MSAWQFTHGRARGAYQRIGDTELYIRQHLAADGMPSGSWSLYVDGRLEGTADRELTAKAAAEAAKKKADEANAKLAELKTKSEEAVKKAAELKAISVIRRTLPMATRLARKRETSASTASAWFGTSQASDRPSRISKSA